MQVTISFENYRKQMVREEAKVRDPDKKGDVPQGYGRQRSFSHYIQVSRQIVHEQPKVSEGFFLLIYIQITALIADGLFHMISFLNLQLHAIPAYSLRWERKACASSPGVQSWGYFRSFAFAFKTFNYTTGKQLLNTSSSFFPRDHLSALGLPGKVKPKVTYTERNYSLHWLMRIFVTVLVVSYSWHSWTTKFYVQKNFLVSSRDAHLKEQMLLAKKGIRAGRKSRWSKHLSDWEKNLLVLIRSLNWWQL